MIVFSKSFGAALQIVGVILLSTRIAPAYVAFEVMLLGSITWTFIGIGVKDWALTAINLTFTITNIIGIWNWARG